MSIVKVVQYETTGVVIHFESTDHGPRIRGDDPEDGYWILVWCCEGRTGQVSCILEKEEADRLAGILNSLSKDDAVFLHEQLYQKGSQDQADQALKNPRYSGRSFQIP